MPGLGLLRRLLCREQPSPPMLPFDVPEETSLLLVGIIVGHVALVGILVCALGRQDTDPDWMKKEKEKQGKAQ